MKEDVARIATRAASWVRPSRLPWSCLRGNAGNWARVEATMRHGIWHCGHVGDGDVLRSVGQHLRNRQVVRRKLHVRPTGTHLRVGALLLVGLPLRLVGMRLMLVRMWLLLMWVARLLVRMAWLLMRVALLLVRRQVVVNALRWKVRRVGADLNVLIRHGRRWTGHHVLRLVRKVDHRLLLLLLLLRLLLLLLLVLLTCRQHVLLLHGRRRWVRPGRKGLRIGV